mmetsp:Transcript_1520/g.3920  ORF Transcript_1520/g.3920 Transcript_1520/m.3920 type:complete len:156 (-) Transcript_1520:327-794(-)
MGQGQSTDGQQVEPYYGVVISPELLEQLDGQPRRKKGAEQAAPRHRPPLGLRPDPFSRGGGGTGGQRVTLIESTRKGDLLLKHEQQEAQMIEQAAADMIKKYYSSEEKPLPCGPERKECVKCFQDNSMDPLVCGPQVKAFTACAQKVQEAFSSST